MLDGTTAHALRYARSTLTLLFALASLLLLAAPAAAAPGEPKASKSHRQTGSKAFQITSLSARTEMVSGGDVLVQIDVAPGIALADVIVEFNGVAITGVFHPAGAQSLRGLIVGLKPGNNQLDVRTTAKGPASRLMLTNYPITGPIFSGPHEQPFICQTQNFNLSPVAGTLGVALDANCSAATRVDYIYRSTGGTLKVLPSPPSYPDDLAETTTLNGATVKYIIRRETGTINRAIYQMTILHDPVAQPTPPDPWTAPAGWNGRLIYTFGGGCTGGWYRQGNSTGGVTDNEMLRRGYAVASSSLNVFGNNCQDLTAAETMMMVKERFIEAYGPPRYTIGFGCSGGSYQQHQIADNYPGLLDGIIPGCSFPEVGFATIQFITDARLLNRYFNTTALGLFSAEEQRQVTGFLNLATMPNVSVGAGRITPTEFCPAALPVALRYNAMTNPTGARCDVYDHTVNVYGRDPVTGFARRPLDNVGIQYGLGALNDGVITTEQFLDLNERIGGYDFDGGFQLARNAADRQAVRRAYQSGRLTFAGGGLAAIPIIDYRAYNDDAPNGDIHVRYHSFSMRERLIKANGHADNQIMLVEDQRYGLYSTASPVLVGAIDAMDRWLAAIAGDTSDDDQIVKVLRNKPADLKEGCWTRDPTPAFIEELQVRGEGLCEALYPSAPAPREVAGASVASDIIKCHLKRIDPSDYAVSFTPAEMARLAAIFPNGVCNWDVPGLDQRRLIAPWLSFGAD